MSSFRLKNRVKTRFFAIDYSILFFWGDKIEYYVRLSYLNKIDQIFTRIVLNDN